MKRYCWGFRERRYRYPRSPNKSVSGRATVSRLYGGIDDDVRRMFFALDSFKLMLVFNEYERMHGKGKREYAEATFAKWRSGSVQMGGEISERLIRIVPKFLSFEQKYELIEKLWCRLRQTTTLKVTISPHGGVDEAIQAVIDAIDALGEQDIPTAVAERLEWLVHDDAIAAQALVAEITKREAEVIVERLQVQLRQLLALTSQHQDKVVTATRTVALPGINVQISVGQSDPNATRKHAMNDLNKPAGESNSEPLVPRTTEESGHNLAPIQNPSDLLGEALRRMSPQKQAEIVAKATDEALRIQVKQADARVDAKRAEDAVDAVARQAGDLSRCGAAFELRREERLEHGRVQVTVKSKPEPPVPTPPLFQRTGCFVATACYGDYSHPAVVVLRRFRDECLRPCAAGRAFIAWYYRTSPRLAGFIVKRPAFRLAGRLLLWPIVAVAQGVLWLRCALHRRVTA